MGLHPDCTLESPGELLKLSFFWASAGGTKASMPQNLPSWFQCASKIATLTYLWKTNDLTCLLRNLYARQEATVRTRHGTMSAAAAAAKSLQLCPTLCGPRDGPPGSAIPGILQARILGWVAIFFSKGSSQPKDRAQVSSMAGGFFTV